jgi:predicted Zn-dependent peptidase
VTDRFQHHRLANGLTVIAEPTPGAHTAAVGFFVKAGTRDEDKPLMGVSHFLEHMMFKGTARRSADDVNREFDEIGANYNAYTSQENTVYYAQMLPEYLPTAVDLFADMLRPALRDSDFEMEKKVIIEEIGMYDDRPQWRLHDAMLEQHFADHPMGYRVLGTVESITALTAEQMRGYFEHRYSPDNITVAAAGAVDFDKLVADIEQRAGDWRATGATRAYPAASIVDRDVTMTDEKLSRHYIGAIAAAPDAQDMRRYAAGVAAQTIGDVDGSRLYWALVDPGLADDADFAHHAHDKLGSFVAFASCDPKRAKKVERILLDTIDRSADELTEGEVERAKNKLATEVTLHGERPGGRMRELGGQWTYLNQYTSLPEEMDRIMAVSLDDVKAQLLDTPFKPRTVVRLGPA